MFRACSIQSLSLVAFICALSLYAEHLGVYSSWNRSIGDARMAASPKTSSMQYVFVAVDSKSLTEIGRWPWSRAVHASLLNALVELGAVDILFDFDFTFPADPAGDRAFEAALDHAGGATFLAVFEQLASVSGDASRHLNLPMQGFASRSWPALVNVVAEADGLVRDYPMGAWLGGDFVSSAGALLAGQFEVADSNFEIDFSIAPESVRAVSAIDVINGNVPEAFIAGRSVVIGAGTIELADQLAIPVHGVVPGPLLHILAAETLMRDLVPRWIRAEVVTLLLFAFLVLNRAGRCRSLWLGIGVSAVGIALLEIGFLIAFRTSSLQVPSAMLLPSLAAYWLCHLMRALTESNWRLHKADIEARNTLGLLECVFNDSSDGIVVLDEDGSVLRYSASASAIFGIDAAGHLDLPSAMGWRDLPEPGVRNEGNDLNTRKMEITREGSRKLLECRATRSRLVTPPRMGKSKTARTITTLVVRDVTRIVEQEQDIAYLSNYDERTGALRRFAFLSFLQMRLDQGGDTLVFAMSLPRFKTVNVTLGRDVGDALLKEVVSRLERLPIHLSAVARLGGTNFAFYTEAAVGSSDEPKLAKVIRTEISRPFHLSDANAQVGVLLGYSKVRSGSEVTAEAALEQAEEALDAAKQSGVAVARFDDSAWEKQRRAREVERAMADALINEEFYLLYQPQHRVSDGALIGAEALVRWNSPSLGNVFPDEFIGIAESTGFIVDLGKWVLERAAKDAMHLPSDLTVAVNVSGIQIMHSELVKDIDAVLKTVGLPAERLCLELTESVLLEATESIIETMQDLRFLGLTWALDDFGTGYSSMEYLSKMPLDKIKLDKSFTMNLGVDPSARPILRSTSDLCRGLGVKLLCEGVETAEQLQELAAVGCAEAQGYFFGKPMSATELGANAKETLPMVEFERKRSNPARKTRRET